MAALLMLQVYRLTGVLKIRAWNVAGSLHGYLLPIVVLVHFAGRLRDERGLEYRWANLPGFASD
jgi:hypothetical protein